MKICFLALCTLFLCGCLVADEGKLLASKTSAQEELTLIDQKIVDLTNKKNLYEAKILRLEINADRWQFENSTYQDARRAWKEIDMINEKIKEIDLQLFVLERQRQDIITDYPSLAKEPA